MMWSFLKKCWPLPIREAHRPRRRESQPATPRARLWLEELESRTVPTTITRTSAPIFYNDLANNLTSAYASYQITNTDGVNYADVWATIGNFTAATGPTVVTLAPNAASAIDLGPLANGQTKTAFFYLGSTTDTTVTQTHTVKVFNGTPTSGTLLTRQNFSFTSVLDTIQANSNKVTSVVVSPSTPTVGGTFTITVTGQTGTTGTSPVFDFTPAAYSSWRADAFQLTGTSIFLSGGNSGVFVDTLLIPPGSIPSPANTNYTAVYTFQAVGPTATFTAVSPVAYISSGANVKHTDTGNFATLPPVQPPLLASPTLNTAPTPVTVTLGTTSVPLNDTAVLANGFRPTGTITFTLVGPGGATVDTETVTVNGNGTYATPTGFTLPATGTATGTYQWNAAYSGDLDNNAANDVNNVNEQVTVSRASPALVTTASPAVTLPTGPPGTVTLTDAALLSGGYFPTGSIVFTLTGPGNFSYTQTDTVSGNGTYSASTTLPTSGPVAGTYTWTVHYVGDANNAAANDQGGIAEQTVVSQASPTLTTAPSPTTVTLGTTPVTLTDSATLANGYHPVGTITFTLVAPGGTTVDTETVTVNGNGTYMTPTGFTLPSSGTVTGTYQWNATYSGGPNNNPASDIGAANEQVTVSAASPTLVTTASPNETLPTGPPGTVTLSDTADLEGGSSPTGNIVFTLTGPAGFTFTQTDTVNGNGTYIASTTLPTTGTVAGTYTWSVTYGGDGNNNSVTETGTALNGEQTVVSPASPTLTTTPSPDVLSAGVTLKDTAALEDGYHPTGTITFTLFFNGGTTPVHTETVAVSGNGIYTTPTGFTPGTASGVYQWNATYSGDPNNNTASDINSPTEQVTVNPPALTLTTIPNPATVTLGINSVTLNDTASLDGGVNPTGTITFTLFHNGGSTPVDTETVTVNGNGIYTTPTGFTLPSSGTATGTYQWDASYSGDATNPAASDVNNVNEQVTVSTASPGLVTIASPSSVSLGANPVTLRDFALLAGGFHPTGTITFTLVGPGGATVDTETAMVHGNGFYRTPTGFTVPSSGTAVGSYQWHATYSGDPNNNPGRELSPVTERVTVSAAKPTLTTSPSPSTVALGTSPVTLTDSATLANGFRPTGAITFTLVGPGGATVDTETVTVNGNGTYTTPTGFTLPTTGTVTGTYQWNATYSGDGNNNTASDVSNVNEQVTVSRASPTLVTTACPAVTLPTGPPGTVTLTDAALLSGGYFPTGSIVFTLTGPGNFSFTQTDTVSGNGTYGAGTTLPTSGPVAGTYTWTAHYVGDANNAAAADQGGIAEQTVVSPASPTLTTAPSPTTVTLGATSVTLTDTADLANGYHPVGTITFTLVAPGGTTVDTETVTVNGNGIYTTPTGFTLPSTGTVTGTYQWNASYGGGPNNNPASDIGAANERVTVSPASPTLVTIATPDLTLPTGPPGTVTLSDLALLSGGYSPSGSIVFTLTYNNAVVGTETVTVNGNGIYTTPTGFTLPITGTVVGTYTWAAHYTGDPNNNAADDQGRIVEHTLVSPASPTLATTPNLTEVTLGDAAPPLLTDTATLFGGYFPTGDITFELFRGSTLVDTETATVNGNGSYTTPTGFTLPTTGGYVWLAVYSGDSNNDSTAESNPTAEQVTVNPASPTIVTTAIPITVALPVPGGTLTDSADLEGGYFPTGSIVFTLTGPGGFSYTQTDTVTGNGTYTATLPTALTLAGTYTWTATYEGDANNTGASDQGGTAEQTMVTRASLSLVTIASPNLTHLTGPPGTVTLSDSAFLSGGSSPTGSIVFTLTGPGGFSFTQTDTVSGNGTYTASTTLPTSGMVTGTYTWTAHYSGDANNNAANDQGGIAEQTVVSPASPALVTIASPNVTLPAGPPGTVTLTDSAFLFFGYYTTGSIVFTLTGPGGFMYTQTDTVSGNGTYTASTTLPTTGMVAGTYTWTAHYSGDANNKAANDQGGIAEQTVVSPGSPTLVTLASSPPPLRRGTGPVTLTDKAVLSGGYYPTGSMVFTLTGPGGFLFTQTDTVSGNGTYTASATLPTTGTVAGAYTWTARYSGDANNDAANDQGGANEQVTVPQASPTLVTTASPATVTQPVSGQTVLTDSAVLSGGFNPTGDIFFTLTGPGGFSYNQIDPVNGNGAYTASTTLPATGPVGGTYIWTAQYAGDPNNSAAIDQGGPAEQTVVSPSADLALTKTVNNAKPVANTKLTYTFLVRNLGPDTATGVLVSDPFPAGLHVVSSSASQGVYNPATNLWNVGTLPVGAQATLKVVVLVQRVGRVVNTAGAVGQQFDPNLANNISSATLTGMLPPPLISKRFFLSFLAFRPSSVPPAFPRFASPSPPAATTLLASLQALARGGGGAQVAGFAGASTSGNGGTTSSAGGPVTALAQATSDSRFIDFEEPERDAPNQALPPGPAPTRLLDAFFAAYGAADSLNPTEKVVPTEMFSWTELLTEEKAAEWERDLGSTQKTELPLPLEPFGRLREDAHLAAALLPVVLVWSNDPAKLQPRMVKKSAKAWLRSSARRQKWRPVPSGKKEPL